MKFAIEIECFGPAPDTELSAEDIDKIATCARHGVASGLTSLAGCVVTKTEVVDTDRLRWELKREREITRSTIEVLDNVREEQRGLRDELAALKHCNACGRPLGSAPCSVCDNDD